MIYQFLALLTIHWIADFVFQTHWQATNKSKNNIALLSHVFTYSIILFIGTALIFGLRFDLLILKFVLINGVLHFITDYITSRINSYLWAKQDIHNFFVSIGFDQLIHQATLALTMIWLLS